MAVHRSAARGGGGGGPSAYSARVPDDAPIRVAICDDSLGFPMLVRAWLRADARFQDVGIADCGERLKDLVAAEKPDMVLLDLVLPDVDDPAPLVRVLHELHAPIRVVLASSMSEDALSRAAGAAGVDGFVHKSAGPDVLLGALHRAAVSP
jgi:DNA-binding NarL/FixJ family response regulator